jgi:hypothetical protein
VLYVIKYTNSAGRYYKPREEDPKLKNIVTAKLGTVYHFSLWKGTVVCLMKLKRGWYSGNAFFYFRIFYLCKSYQKVKKLECITL